MARSILDNDNVVAAGGNYPYGRLKDQSFAGAGDGTPVKEVLLGDQAQFFTKLMDDAGVTPNGLPDNSLNGFQLNTALDTYINNKSPQVQYGGYTEITSLTLSPVSEILTTYFVFNLPTVVVEMNLSGSDARDIVTFGDSMPLGTMLTIYFNSGSGGFDFIINSTNTGVYPQIKVPGNATPNNLYSPTTSTFVQVLRTSDGWVMQEVA